MAEAREVVTALMLLLAMFLSAILGLRQRIGIVLLGLLSLSWFTVDKLFEGNVLFELTRHNGFTATDIIGVLGLAVTAALGYAELRRVKASR